MEPPTLGLEPRDSLPSPLQASCCCIHLPRCSIRPPSPAELHGPFRPEPGSPLAPQAHLPQKGNSSSELPRRMFLSCRLETSAGWKDSQLPGAALPSLHPAALPPPGRPQDRQSHSPDVDIVVMPALPFRYRECHFSRYGGDGQFCTPGFSDSDSYEEQSPGKPTQLPLPAQTRQHQVSASRVLPGHQPSHHLPQRLPWELGGSNMVQHGHFHQVPGRVWRPARR